METSRKNKGKRTLKSDGKRRIVSCYTLLPETKERLQEASNRMNYSSSSIVDFMAYLLATDPSVFAKVNNLTVKYDLMRGTKTRKNKVDFNPATASDFAPVADPLAMPNKCEKPTNALQTNESIDGNSIMGIMRSGTPEALKPGHGIIRDRDGKAYDVLLSDRWGIAPASVSLSVYCATLRADRVTEIEVRQMAEKLLSGDFAIVAETDCFGITHFARIEESAKAVSSSTEAVSDEEFNAMMASVANIGRPQ